MPRSKEIDNPKRFNAVVNQHTYDKLVTLVGQKTMLLGRPYSLAELVRSILENAISDADMLIDTISSRSTMSKEMHPAVCRPVVNGECDGNAKESH